MNFEKLSGGFVDTPIVSGPNVFLRSEYQAAIGISSAYAGDRLRSLVAAGKIRKVRTRRDGRLVSAWEYVPARRRKVSSE